MKRLSDLPTRDIELLSAFIDRGLSPRQERKLLARLEEEPDLHWALDELRRTAAVLRGLPEVRPPRSFVLTQETSRSRERIPAYPVLQLATALATLAFVAVVGLDTLVSQNRLAAPAPFAGEQAERQAEVPAEATLVVASEAQPEEAPQALGEAPVGTPTPMPTTEGIGGGEPPVALPGASEALTAQPAEEAMEDRALIGPETPCVGCGGGGVEEPEAGELPYVAQAPPQASLPPEATSTGGPAEKSALPPTGGELGNAPTSFSQPSPSRPGVSVLRLAEISLGLAAVIMAGLTFWVRRRG